MYKRQEYGIFKTGDIVKSIWGGRLAIVVEVCEPWTWDGEGLDFHRFVELDSLAMSTMCEEDAEEWDTYSDFYDNERWTRERHGDKGLKLCRFGDNKMFYAPQDTWETEVICQENVKSDKVSLRQSSQRVTL